MSLDFNAPPPSNYSRPDITAGSITNTTGGASGTDKGPPPIPPRSSSTGRYGGGAMGYSPYASPTPYGGMGMGYGSGLYGASGYGGYPGFSRFGGSAFDGSYENESPLLRVADEASRPAFQSIESILQAVGAINMMLESSYSAVYNSFRAVIGVADNFVRLKSQLINALAALSVFRTLRLLFRKLLRFLRLRAQTADDDLWEDLSRVGQDSASGDKPRSSWPFILFFALISVGPWLIWRLLSSVMNQDNNEWAKGKKEHYLAIGLYDFTGENEDELSFRTGQQILIAPKERQPRTRGWILGSIDGRIGLIPQNYINILGKRRGMSSRPAPLLPDVPGDESTATTSETPIVDTEREQSSLDDVQGSSNAG